MKKYIIVILLVFIFSCKSEDLSIDKTPLAQVNEIFLYLEEILEILPQNLSEADSITYISNYIDIWVNEQLLYSKAEQYLSDEKDEIDNKVQDFRSSLFIHKYKEKFLNQKLDTVITFDEVNEYYTAHPDDFRLQKCVIKGYFVKISKTHPEISTLKTMLHSGNPNNTIKIRNFCLEGKGLFNGFNNNWTYFPNILSQIPEQIKDNQFFLKTHRYIETNDEQYYYFLKINDYKLFNEITPLNICQNNIKSIILKKRSKYLVEELEKSILKNAIDKGDIEYFN